MKTITLQILINVFVISLGMVGLVFLGKLVYATEYNSVSNEEVNWDEIDIVTTCEGKFTIIKDSTIDPE